MRKLLNVQDFVRVIKHNHYEKLITWEHICQYEGISNSRGPSFYWKNKWEKNQNLLCWKSGKQLKVYVCWSTNATYKWEGSVVALLLAFGPPSSPAWESHEDIGHIPIVRPLSLLSKGKEQTLISKILFVYLEPSGDYLKDWRKAVWFLFCAA